MLKGGPAPKTGDLEIGALQLRMKDGIVQLVGAPATGGSAPYLYEFQKSLDNGQTWIPVGRPIHSMETVLRPIEISESDPHLATVYRLKVSDGAEPAASAQTATVRIPR
jgi:hypothetical protein